MNYSLMGWGAGTTLTFSDLQFDVPADLTGLTVSVDGGALPRVIGLTGGALIAGTDYLFDRSQNRSPFTSVDLAS